MPFSTGAVDYILHLLRNVHVIHIIITTTMTELVKFGLFVYSSFSNHYCARQHLIYLLESSPPKFQDTKGNENWFKISGVKLQIQCSNEESEPTFCSSYPGILKNRRFEKSGFHCATNCWRLCLVASCV